MCILGFTVGAWDLFHEGHSNFLTQCKSQCTYLIVGIVTDYWIRVQKGHDRPDESLQLRITQLRDKKLADKIVIIDTLDISQYLQMVDIWFKGNDQKNMRPVEFSRTIFIPRTLGISTTQRIEDRGNTGGR